MKWLSKHFLRENNEDLKRSHHKRDNQLSFSTNKCPYVLIGLNECVLFVTKWLIPLSVQLILKRCRFLPKRLIDCPYSISYKGLMNYEGKTMMEIDKFIKTATSIFTCCVHAFCLTLLIIVFHWIYFLYYALCGAAVP